jgi:hypothetical protein
LQPEGAEFKSPVFHVKQIYALLGGEPRKVVYVGCANNAVARVKSHWGQRNSTYRSPVKDWLCNLAEPPEHFVFEEVPDEIAFQAEQYYTETIRAMGIELLNLRDGMKYRPEVKQKIRKANTGRKPTPEQVAKQVQAQTGKLLSQAHRDAISRGRLKPEVNSVIRANARAQHERARQAKKREELWGHSTIGSASQWH